MNRAVSWLGCDGHGLVSDHLGGFGAQPEGGLGDGGEYRSVVQHLMGVAVFFGGIDAASEHQHRHPVLMGIGDHVDAIERARSKGCHQNHRRAICVMHAFAHEARGVLVLCQMERNSSGFQRIDKCQHLAAGHAKGVTAARLIQPPGQDVGGAQVFCHGAYPSERELFRTECADVRAAQPLSRGCDCLVKRMCGAG